jgi:transcriptional regulator with XRE-family HTH domain
MSIGSNLKRLRSEKGLTQGELAEKSQLGLNMVSKLERDATDPRLSSLYKLINVLDCTADDLLNDVLKSNMGTKLKIHFERVSKIPEHEQQIICEIISKYCTGLEYELLADMAAERKRLESK